MNSTNTNKKLFDDEIVELIPHRPPMLLINHIVSVDARSSSTLVLINSEASFYREGKGVPSWVGLEYMGQTAALIGGYQQREGMIEPSLGFLLGTRSFSAETDFFKPDSVLRINCQEKNLVGGNLANFDCTIAYQEEQTDEDIIIAKASLSVFRKSLSEENK